MKKLYLSIVIALFLSWPARANPIFLEYIVKEIYFVGNDWTIILDNEFMILLGATSFEGLQIQTNSGELIFKEDFVFNPNSWYTVITNDELQFPVIINPSIGYIDVEYFDFYLPGLSWSNNPNAMVHGPEEGQSLNIFPILLDYFVFDWWTVKGNNINCYNSSCSCFGYFSGYLTDQNNNPVPNAEIRYLENYYMQIPYFSPLITNQSGYFHIHLPARNYHLFNIVIDGMDYEFDEWVTIEPDENNLYNFQIFITNIHETAANSSQGISSFPNPFSNKTTFNIPLHGIDLGKKTVLKIIDLTGQTVEYVEFSCGTINGEKMALEWENKSLSPGCYFVTIGEDGMDLYSHKIIIQ